MFVLRDYQGESVAGVRAALDEHGSTLLHLATGLGKTIVFAELADHYWNVLGRRTMVVAPKNILVDQAADKIFQRTGCKPDIERAHQRANETEWGKQPFVVSSAQTMTLTNKKTGRKRHQKFRDFGLLVLDEAHDRLTPATLEMVDHFRRQGAHVLAVTATPKRLDGVGMNNLVSSVAYQMGILEGIDAGWLVCPETRIVQIHSLELSAVRTHGSKGDFVASELQKVLEQEQVTYEIAEVVARESGTLKTAVFCASVAQAKKVAELLADQYALRTGWICADKRLCSDDHRKDVMDSFTRTDGGIQIVCNVGILTTGWDFDALQHIVMARPTKSAGLYEQVMGRGTRPLAGVVDGIEYAADRQEAIAASEKPHFKMTDLVDNSLRHKLITSLDVLAGEAAEDLLRKAKDLADDETRGRTFDELISEAKAILEAEEREKRRLEEEAKRIAQDRQRERLARYKGEANYSTHDVDPFDPMQRGAGKRLGGRSRATMPFGKNKGKNLSDMTERSLEFYVSKDGDPDFWTLKPWLRTAMEAELSNREPEPATAKQIGFMKWKNIPIPGDCTKSQASATIDRFNKPQAPARQREAITPTLVAVHRGVEPTEHYYDPLEYNHDIGF